MRFASILFVSLYLGDSVAYKTPVPASASLRQIPVVSQPPVIKDHPVCRGEARSASNPRQVCLTGHFPSRNGQNNLPRGHVATRLDWIKGAASTIMFSVALGVRPSRAALQGLPLRPPEGNCNGCLGVINGLLAPCDTETNCVSSQDEGATGRVFQEPWTYEGSTDRAIRKLRDLVESIPGVEVVKVDGIYLRYELTSERGDVDDLEFYFTPNDYTVQFRASRRTSKTDKGANARLMERLRIALRFEKLPVLRNRQRALFFVESPFDSFGPVYGEPTPIPEEMDRNEVFQDRDPRAPIWQPPPPYPKE